MTGSKGLILRLRNCLVLCAVASVAGGCALEQSLTVLPNGSGKLVLRLALEGDKPIPLDGRMLAVVTRPDEVPFRGHYAVALRTESEGDRTILELTAWFVDINELRVVSRDGTLVEYRFEPGEKSSRLVVVNRIPAELAELADFSLASFLALMTKDVEAEAARKAAHRLPELFREPRFRSLLRRARYAETYTLPGPLTSVEGATKTSADTATLVLDPERFVTPEGRVGLARETKRTIACGPSTVSEEAMRAFDVELADARTKWKLRCAIADRDREKE